VRAGSWINRLDFAKDSECKICTLDKRHLVLDEGNSEASVVDGEHD